jgi:hypothetical protein
MQKIYALVFMLLFSTMQYGKLVSYWKCKVTNIGEIPALQCDCEKILSASNSNENPSLFAKINFKEKTDECLRFYSIRLIRSNCIERFKHTSKMTRIPTVLFSGSIFQPPRNS